jgi:hypothetical protein
MAGLQGVSRPPPKNTGRRDECRDGLLFPPERGEYGRSLFQRKGKIVSLLIFLAQFRRKRRRFPELGNQFPPEGPKTIGGKRMALLVG